MSRVGYLSKTLKFRYSEKAAKIPKTNPYFFDVTKGQLIPEQICGVLNFPKMQQNKKRSNKKK